MFNFDGLGVFMASILNHWVAWGTGSALSLILAGAGTAYNWKVPKWAYLAFLVVGFIVSGFQAWQDQYKENEASRLPGSLYLVKVDSAFLNLPGSPPDALKHNTMQVVITIQNLQPRLISYHKFDTVIDSKKAPEVYPNNGGYVNAGAFTTWRCPYVENIDTTQSVIPMTLDYAISYHLVGSKQIHHTSKKMNIWWHASDGSTNNQYVSEYED
jgi:hypothetical protein